MTTALIQWLNTYRSEITAFSSMSVVLLLVTLLATPWLVSLLPVDYFRGQKRKVTLPVWAAVSWSLLRNVVGSVFMVLGLLMLVLPGPGLVCFILGLSLCEFPGKQAFLRSLIARYPGILTSLNWLRRKSGKEQLLPPED